MEAWTEMIADDNSMPLPGATLPMPDLIKSIEDAQAAGRLVHAHDLCEVAIARQPENASLRVWLGWIALERKAYAEAVAAARHAATLPEHDAVGIARLLTYSAALSGEWMLADNVLHDLSKSNESAAHDIAIETSPAFLAHLNELRQNNAYQQAIECFEQVPKVLAGVSPAIMREISVTASVCYLALGNAEAAIAIFAHGGIATCFKRQPTTSRVRPLLVTSLMPTRLDVQKAAVESWCRLGFDVVSLNSSDEVNHLHSEFGDVSFHVAGRDARQLLGRPLVYLDDMLDVLARQPGRTGGIINSDIVFSIDSGEVMTEAVLLSSDAFLFGHRLDIERLEDFPGPSSQLYLFGYDWFLFRADQASQLAGGNMVFGAPWWDIWLPLRAKSLGLDIINVRRPIALHENHIKRWSQAELADMGRILANTLIAGSSLNAPITSWQRRMGELASALHNMTPAALADGRNLDWLASLLRGLIQSEAATFGGRRHAEPFLDTEGQI